jgi:hypothetical protein
MIPPRKCPLILELHGPTELALFALLPSHGVNARNYGNQDDGCDKTILYGQGVRSVSKYSPEGVHLDLSYATCLRRRAVYCSCLCPDQRRRGSWRETPIPNTAPQAGLRLARFLFMQATILSTSGTSSLHSRITSGVHACCISGVPRYWAFALDPTNVESKIPAIANALAACMALNLLMHCAIATPPTLRVPIDRL